MESALRGTVGTSGDSACFLFRLGTHYTPWGLKGEWVGAMGSSDSSKKLSSSPAVAPPFDNYGESRRLLFHDKSRNTLW